jgi:hypothetical protein
LKEDFRDFIRSAIEAAPSTEDVVFNTWGARASRGRAGQSDDNQGEEDKSQEIMRGDETDSNQVSTATASSSSSVPINS